MHMQDTHDDTDHVLFEEPVKEEKLYNYMYV